MSEIAIAGFLKDVSVTIVMSIIARLGGRKYDQYLIMMAGASFAGITLLGGVVSLVSTIANNPIIKGIGNAINWIIGLF